MGETGETMAVRVGTAGWSIAKADASRFPDEGSVLQRYAARLPVAEINSSFHRPHRPGTWQRWRETVPPGFRFSVKLPKTITHEQKLVDCDALLDRFLADVEGLGETLAVLLVQLPPKLAFDRGAVQRFFARLTSATAANVVCEPRNLSWFDGDADDLLCDLRVARVAADPASCPAAAEPGGWRGLSYYRLHGSPVIYRSSYGDRIAGLADRLRLAAASGPAWCIFDNTASSAALTDALSLIERLQRVMTD